MLLDVLKHAWPIDELHRDVGRANLLAICRGDFGNTGGVNLGDARMIQPAQQLRLALKAPKRR